MEELQADALQAQNPLAQQHPLVPAFAGMCIPGSKGANSHFYSTLTTSR